MSGLTFDPISRLAICPACNRKVPVTSDGKALKTHTPSDNTKLVCSGGYGLRVSDGKPFWKKESTRKKKP